MRLSLVAIALGAALLVHGAAAQPVQALFEDPLTKSTCIAGKVKCVSKLKACLFSCHRKALNAGLPPDPACLRKCRDKFETDPPVPGKGCFARSEAKGGCGASVGDASTFAAKVDAYVLETIQQLVPGGGNPGNKCAAGKVACVRKYNACVLSAVNKAASYGTKINVATCKHILDDHPLSCMSKLETKYCAGANLPGCTSILPPCLTYGDAFQLRNQDDFFVDDAIAAFATGPVDMNSQRCSGDTSVACSSAPGGVAGCGGPLGTCEFYFSAPLPYVISNIPICVTRRWSGSISGTFDQTTGTSAGTAAVLAEIYNGIIVDHPCPRCVDDPFPNDGVSAGSCDGGPRNGLACDGNGRSPEPSFGVTSLDCPPTGLVSTIGYDLDNSTGTMAPALTAASPNCNGSPGDKCLCASCSGDSTIACRNDADCTPAGAGTCNNPAGEPRKPNACVDNTSLPGDGTLCAGTGDGSGVCSDGPVVQRCLIQRFRACTTPTDCPLTDDTCVTVPRSCFAGYNGVVGDTVSGVGHVGNGRNGAAAMGFASVFCYPPTAAPGVNAASGFPGPGRLQLTGVGADDGGPGCPTTASFLPTSASAVLDAGWTGHSHGYHAVGQGKITVAASCTGTYPDCSCSYTGPIQNPNVVP